MVPKSTLGNWISEFNRFCPSLRTFRFHGTKEERSELLERVKMKERDWDVLITTYEMAVIEKGSLSKIEWKYNEWTCYVMNRYLIIDEAHRIKNEDSKLSTTLRKFNVENRLLLTGTPLQVRYVLIDSI